MGRHGMIDITREGTNLVVTLTGNWPIHGMQFSTTWPTGTEWAARLLHEHMTQHFASEMTRIRREAYAQGWKDAKGHKTKETWFLSTWT